MANRLIEHGAVSAEFGPVGGGSIILAAEVGTLSGDPPQLGNTMMSSGEQWTVEMADAEIDENRRIWTPVHFTGTMANQRDFFNGITDTNRSIDFFTAPGYLYRVRKTAGTSTTTNTNVAITWDVCTTRIWR